VPAPRGAFAGARRKKTVYRRVVAEDESSAWLKIFPKLVGISLLLNGARSA